MARDIGGFDPTAPIRGGAAYGHRHVPTLEDILESGLYAAGETPNWALQTHLSATMIFQPQPGVGESAPPAAFAAVWIPAFAGMTGVESGNGGRNWGWRRASLARSFVADAGRMPATPPSLPP